MFQVEDSLRYRSWKVDEQEMTLVVQVVLAAFIHDTHEVILGGPRIRNDPIDLAWNERRLVIGVVDTQSKWLCRLFHFSSKYAIQDAVLADRRRCAATGLASGLILTLLGRG